MSPLLWISKEKIILDPGFGYEKTPYENLEIISKFNYTKFENPCLIGISRKGFLKKLSNDPNLDQTSVTTGIISLLNYINENYKFYLKQY